MASDASSSTVQKPPCSKALASKYRKEITQGQGWVGSGKNIVFKTFTPAEIEFKRKRIDAYDGWMETHGTSFRAGVGKWAKQLHTTTSAIKKDTTATKKTVEDIEVRTMATHEEVLKLRKDVADYKEKVQTHTQPSLSKLQIVAMMAGPSTPVRVLKSILDSEGLECQGNKQDKAVFLGERFAEHKLLELIAEHKNIRQPEAPDLLRHDDAKEEPGQNNEALHTNGDEKEPGHNDGIGKKTAQEIVDEYIHDNVEKDVEAIIANVEKQQQIEKDVTVLMNRLEERQKRRKLGLSAERLPWQT